MIQPVTDQQIRQLLQSDEDQLLNNWNAERGCNARFKKSADVELDLLSADLKAMGIKDDMKDLGSGFCVAGIEAPTNWHAEAIRTTRRRAQIWRRRWALAKPRPLVC